MTSGQDLVSLLRDHKLSNGKRVELVHQFARTTGWRPSYELDYPEAKDLACGHLLVEHGLQPLVAITFLRRSRSYDRLDQGQKHLLLSISYNNLVDWHYFTDRDGLWMAYNRSDRLDDARYVSLADNPNAWMADEFDKLVGRRPSPNLPALDNALIGTVSAWKRMLAAELQTTDLTEPISELFNAILFVRALEDYRRKKKPSASRALLDNLDVKRAESRTIRKVLLRTARTLSRPATELPDDLWDHASLAVFDRLDSSTVRQLLGDFYDNRFAPYRYDFSLISKYALSHIYEHYISELKVVIPEQPLLFPEPPVEVVNRDVGAYYTPHFIARFFARFLDGSFSPPVFRSLKVADPACGSGMFLRTLLEMQCDPSSGAVAAAVARTAFAGVLGIDVQTNACKATRLSLSLLYLVVTGDFPDSLGILNEEAISYLSDHPEMRGTFDAVIANPPFVKWEKIPQAWQPKVASVLSGYDAPKADLYMAFLKVSLDLIRPGGFLLFVLPRSFLVSRNAMKLRSELTESCWIRFLADLSDINVFDEASTYPILLILERRPERPSPSSREEPKATLVKCVSYPGHALEEALEGRQAENGFYSIYSVSQDSFRSDAWRIASPKDLALQERVARFPPLGTFVAIRQGFITGKDKVFIRDQTDVPEAERSAYAPYLSDREMRRYQVPQETGRVVFYPFDGERLLTEDEVRRRFPRTWEYLESRSDELKNRKSLERIGRELWWRPVWPRPPRHLLRPKIVGPHLMLFPRFALDASGTYAVTHSPIILNKEETDDLQLLKYILGVMNSPVGHWQIIHQSHRYRHGYAMLEVNTLKEFRLPSPAAVPTTKMIAICSLVDQLIEDPKNLASEAQLGGLVADIFGIAPESLKEITVPAPRGRHGR